MESIIFWSATTGYALGTVAAIAWLATQREGAERWARWFAVAGLVFHAVAIGMRWSAVGHGPYATRYEVVSANTFVLVACWVVVSQLARGLRMLSPLVLPVAFLLMGWAVTSFEVRYDLPIIFRSWWLLLHIGFAKLFAATIFLSASCAVAQLVKRRSPERLARLPGVEALDLYGHQLMLSSFLFLAVMIIAGSLWAAQGWGRYWGWDPIETSALVTWVIMGLILHMRVLHGWTGARMAWLSLLGLLFAIVTVYVVALVVPTIHSSYMVGK